MGGKKSLKNFQKTSKICEFPSQQAAGARKQGRKVPQSPRKQRQAQNQVAGGRWQVAVERYKKSPS